MKLDAEKYERALMFYGAVRRHHLGTTASHASVEMMYQLTGRHARANLPTLEHVRTYPFDETAAWIRANLLNGPLEIGIVGDVDPSGTIELVAATVGTLAPRHERPLGDDERLSAITKPYRNILPSPAPDSAAAVRAAWPVAAAADANVHAALQVGVDVLVDRLQRKLREELSVTYSPAGGVQRDVLQRDFASAWVALSFDPKRAKSLAERTLRIAGDLAKGGVTREEFKRLVEPRQSAATASLQSNAWWLAHVLRWAQTVPSVLDDALALEAIYARLTRGDVDRVLKHLAPANGSAVVIMPAGAEMPEPKPASAKTSP